MLCGIAAIPHGWAEEKLSPNKDNWTLEESINRLIDANELVQSTNESVNSLKSLIGSSRIPNPELELGVTNEFRVNTGKSGYDYNSITISQSFPIAELLYGKDVDQTTFKIGHADRENFILRLKLNFALLYREFQYKKGLLSLADTELSLLRDQISNKKQKLVRFQGPLDKSKMELIVSEALINRKSLEEEIHELEARVKTYLKISNDEEFNISPIQKLKAINFNVKKTAKHPKIKSLTFEKLKYEKLLSKERAKRFGNIELTAFRQREFIFNKPTDTNGAMLKITLPLWDWKNSQVDSLSFKKAESELELKSIERIHLSELEVISKHYQHQIEIQKLYFDTKIPKAKIFLDNTIKSYSVGQTTILSLIDAYKEYFGSKRDLLELLYGGWKEYEELRYFTSNFQSEEEEK